MKRASWVGHAAGFLLALTASRARAQTAEPLPHQFELGAFLGVFLPSNVHNLRADERPQQPYASVAAELGLRLGYLPIPYAGVEVEGMVAPTTVESGGSATLFAGRAQLIGQLPIGRFAPFLVFGAGKLGAASSAMGTDIDPALHFGVGGKFAITEVILARLDLRDTLSQRVSTPSHLADNGDLTSHWEISLGVSLALGVRHASETKAPVPKDTEPSACPTEPAPVQLDADHDGISLPDDKCPEQPETKNGFADDDGCPDELPEKLRQFTGVIAGIEFDTGKAMLTADSEPALTAALVAFTEYPKTRVEISVHSDDAGEQGGNTELSQQRAESVKAWFVAKGIEPRRIETRGAGPDESHAAEPDEPHVDDESTSDHQKNGRVEFKLLE